MKVMEIAYIGQASSEFPMGHRTKGICLSKQPQPSVFRIGDEVCCLQGTEQY
jgi:hypothetical protein